MGSSSSLPEERRILEGLKQANCDFGDIYFGHEEILYLAKELEKKEHKHVRSVRLVCRAEGAEALGELIAKNTSLTSMVVQGSDEYSRSLTWKAFGVICKGLVANETLTSFGISSAPEWTRLDVDSLIEVIRCNKALRELQVERWENVAWILLEEVIEARRIEKLRFARCGISPGCLQGMLEVLRRNTTLLRLYLEREVLGIDGVCMLGELLSKDATLEELSLVYCQLETTGLASIAKGLKTNKSLCRLDLSHNKLGPQGTRVLADVLRENDVLEELVLSFCSLETQGIDVLVDALLHNTSLKTLDVSGNALNSGKSIARLLANNSCLTKLDLSHGDLKDVGVAEIAAWLQENSTLKELILRGCGFARYGAIRLAEVLQSNSTLKVLDVRTSLADDGMRALAGALVGNKTMTSFYMWPYPEDVIKQCGVWLMKGNGSLLECGHAFGDVCARNRVMHERARQAVQALRVLRWRQGESILHMLLKEVVKMIGLALWNTRTEIAVWAKQK